MIYYADYEALEFNNQEAQAARIYPYYLNPNITETSLCPIMFSACNSSGTIVNSQNCFNSPVSFMKFLDKQITFMRNVEHKIMFVWFHNVQYDFRIIVHELFYNEFTHIMDSENITYIGEYQTEQDKAFSIIGENLSKYIGINLYYRGFKVMIRDTMSILNSAQDKILSDFGYKSKVAIPWQEITLATLRDYMAVIRERNHYDITSLAACIEEFKATFAEHFHGKGSTAAGMSLDALKHYLCVTNGITEINHDSKNEFFRECYPMLSGFAQDISRGCYHGGICTMDYSKAGRVLERLQMVDINSSYPYSMTMPLPYGEGVPVKDFVQGGYSEYVVYISFTHTGIPFQRCHSENKALSLLNMTLKGKAETYTRSQFPKKFTGYLCINSIDLDTLIRNARVTKLEFKRGITYKTNTVLRDFVVPIYEERKHSKGVKKLAIKLLLNSLYGKYAQDLGGIVFSYSSLDEYTKVQAIDNDTIYKPFASAVTAYSRQNWIDTVYLLGSDFVYGDTDSIYFENVERCTAILEKAGKLHENELGKWAFDDDYGEYITRGKFLSKKNYILDLQGRTKVTCVGLSHKYHSQVNFDNFVIDSVPFEVYKMVNVYGGKAMRQTEFKIKERSYY